MPEKKGLIQRLEEGVVIGDGGFVFCLEKRGYLKAGPWTPEVSVEHPEALRELHREFLRAGADVMQTFTFYGSEDKLANRGNDLGYTCTEINDAACRIAKEVAAEGDALVAGGLSQTPSYLNGDGKLEVQKMFQGQIDSFLKHNLDFLIVEYFEHVEEIEWALEVCRKTNLPVVASMAIGPDGDLHGIPAGECAVRMARAGAVAVGVNCHFDPFMNLRGLKKMKQGLENAGLDNVYLISQPLGFLTPEVNKQGFTILPEFPFALEPRICTRFEIQKFAREAYNLGVRYIGGCCGFESYHIRAVTEELSRERGNKAVPASVKHQVWGEALKMHTKPWVRARAGRDYWEKMNPTTGRPHSAGLRTVVDWEVAPGDKELKQMRTKTTQQEIEQLRILQTQKVEQKEKVLGL